MFGEQGGRANIAVSLTSNPRVFEHVCLLWSFVQGSNVPADISAQVIGELKGMAFAFRACGNSGISEELLFLSCNAAIQLKKTNRRF